MTKPSSANRDRTSMTPCYRSFRHTLLRLGLKHLGLTLLPGGGKALTTRDVAGERSGKLCGVKRFAQSSEFLTSLGSDSSL